MNLEHDESHNERFVGFFRAAEGENLPFYPKSDVAYPTSCVDEQEVDRQRQDSGQNGIGVYSIVSDIDFQCASCRTCLNGVNKSGERERTYIFPEDLVLQDGRVAEPERIFKWPSGTPSASKSSGRCDGMC